TPADTGEVKKLRAELAEAKADTERARKEAGKIADLQRQNADLNSKLAAAEKKAAAPATPEAVDAELQRKLRRENSYLRNLLDTFAAKNPELKGQLRNYKPTEDTTPNK